mgnify:CR=1 FL=1
MSTDTKTHSVVLVLASKSRRRLSIIRNAWPYSFVIKPSTTIEDTPNINETVQAYTSRIALDKIKIISKYKSPKRLFVSADTAVYVDGSILLKPSSDSNALMMLEKLRNKEHIVSTSVSINSVLLDEPIVFNTTTKVRFNNYSFHDMKNYIAACAPLDKSGGYAIQDKKFNFVSKITGCYLNVVGLPMCSLTQQIGKISPDVAKRIKLLSCTSCKTNPSNMAENTMEVK